MDKLYPPNIEGTIPAFYPDNDGTTTLVVPFSMNKAVAIGDVNGMVVKIKYTDGTLLRTINTPCTSQDEFNGEYVENGSLDINDFVVRIKFKIKFIQEYLSIGSYYKIQLAYVNKNAETGYFSTIGVVKYTSKPEISILGLSNISVNPHHGIYTIKYKQNQDITEKMNYCKLTVKNDEDKIIYDSGYVLHNITEDTSSYESIQKFSYNEDLQVNHQYTIFASVITSNGIELNSKVYKITQLRSIKVDDKLKINTELNYDNGYIKITLETVDPNISTIPGNYLISKCCSKDGYKWYPLKNFKGSYISVKTWRFLDYNIEQGYYYKYCIQQYNENDIYSEKIISKTIYADFEHSFLYDTDKQLKIMFNPKITNFKNNIQETSVETIGSQFPFILRNGNIYYKTFQISGLISFQTDSQELFLNEDDYKIKQNNDGLTFDSDLTGENIRAERIFKMAVLEWLNNGKLKVFKSSTEGNFIVRLTNISLTPEDKLGRMLHSFSAQAIEIAEYSPDILSKYNLTEFKAVNYSEVLKYASIDLRSYLRKWDIEESKQFQLILGGKYLFYMIEIKDIIPGTIIRIDGKEIMIGTTGYFFAENASGFSSLEIKPNDYQDPRYELDYPIFTYSYKEIVEDIDNFNSIIYIDIEDIPTQQIITAYNGQNIFETLSTVDSTISSFGYVRLKARAIYNIFVDQAYTTNFLPGETTGFFSDPLCTNALYRSALNKTVLYEVRFKQSVRDVEDDFVNRNLDFYSPSTHYLYDPYFNAFIPKNDSLFEFILNNEEIINLKDAITYNFDDTSIIDSIILNQGLILEMSYSKQNNTYNFSTNNPERNAVNQYLNIDLPGLLESFHSSLLEQASKVGTMTQAQRDSYLSTLKQIRLTYKDTYTRYVGEIAEALEWEKEHEAS